MVLLTVGAVELVLPVDDSWLVEAIWSDLDSLVVVMTFFDVGLVSDIVLTDSRADRLHRRSDFFFGDMVKDSSVPKLIMINKRDHCLL